MTASSNPPRQHGVKGVYYAGEWLDFEDCEGKFNGSESGCSGCHHNKEVEPCPRSASRNATANHEASDHENAEYDVCIVGAGCIGAAVARELSKYSLKILWLEAADDVSQGATKGNSGIVHAGYDDKPGTNHAKYCWKGNQMFKDLDRDLRFGYQVNGSFVLCTKEEDRKVLQELMERGAINGVENLRIVEKKELFEMEPHLNPNCIAALYAPDAGNVIPYEFTIALAENAVDNGVELRIRREVSAIEPTKDGMTVTIRHWEPKEYVEATKGSEWTTDRLGGVIAAAASAAASLALGKGSVASYMLLLASIAFCGHQLYSVYLTKGGVGRVVSKLTPLTKLVAQAGKPVGSGGEKINVEDMMVGGSGSAKVQHGVTVGQETIRTKFVINCAGGASDKIANMIGDTSFKIKPRVGDYLLLNRNQGHLTYRTLFPCPDPVLGKGVLVQTTLWGNLILGPTARDMHLPEKRDMDSATIQEYILSKCKELVPTFDAKETIHAFAGSRAKSDRGDWVIENSVQDGRMIHVAGIDSPGLAGSPAIALEVVRLLQESGCSLPKNPDFNPRRAPIIAPKMGMRGLKMGPVGKNDSDGKDEHQMSMNVICKCEKVTELEVVRALRRSLPIDSTQAIRKRTRAGMGHCQGDPDNYNCEARVKAIIARECGTPMDQVGGRPWPATSTLSERWPEEAEKLAMEQRMKA